jgi:hypothetical protein
MQMQLGCLGHRQDDERVQASKREPYDPHGPFLRFIARNLRAGRTVRQHGSMNV